MEDIKGSNNSWGLIAKIFHWVLAVFILSQIFFGINLHYMPLIERELWLNLLTKVGAEYIKNNDRILLPKEIITRLTAKSKYAIKQYDINKISKVRKVPYNKIGTLAAFIPPTHEGKSYLDIVADYNLYKPGQ